MADLPIGSIVMFSGTTPPAGWYDCDGASHSGVVTPNLIGKFPTSVPSGGTLGATGGSDTHIHTNLDTGYQTHGHAQVSGTTVTASGTTVSEIWGGDTTSGVGSHTHPITIAALTNQDSHKHTMPNTAAGTSLPPYIRLRYIMRCE